MRLIALTCAVLVSLPANAVAASDVQVALGDGIRFSDTHGRYSAQLGGRLEVHAAAYRDDGVDMGNGAILRRARLYLKGVLDHHWLFKLDHDFTVAGVGGLRDAYLGYRRADGIRLYAGNYRVPYSLEFQANSHALMFQERSLGFAFSPGWRVGGAAVVPRPAWQLEFGLFGDRPARTAQGADGEWLAAMRVSGRPYRRTYGYLHLGAALLYGDPGDLPSLRYRSTPESRVTAVNLVDTGALQGVKNYLQHGLEASWTWKRFNLQTEYMAVELSRDTDELLFSGWYVQSSVFLTDDSRRYKGGRYVPVNPGSVIGHGGHGAWELALRYSGIDLSSGVVAGGEQDNLSLALNLYATRHVRLSAEYVRVLEAASEPDAVQMRMEWVY